MGKQVSEMTLQEAIDYAVQQIVKQGGQALREDTLCVYKTITEQGQCRHCAVGWLLDHSNEDLMRSASTVQGIVDLGLDGIPQLIKDNLGLFRVLQRFHDEESIVIRERILIKLQGYGIDTSGEWWNQWVEMGR